MIDLHCHILPGLDDGAPRLEVSLQMARMLAADGVIAVACTPHILPGVYSNNGLKIRAAVARFRAALTEADIPLDVFAGSDAHITPDFVDKLARGQILSLADSRYVLIEPPHDLVPLRLEQFFLDVLLAGYVPIFTHPERMQWVRSQYRLVQALARSGVWMQLTAGSLTGDFGREAQFWSERMLDEGLVHVIATDAHDAKWRPPSLSRGYEAAAARIGEVEARRMVVTRPWGIIQNACPSTLRRPPSAFGAPFAENHSENTRFRTSSFSARHCVGDGVDDAERVQRDANKRR